MESFQFFVGIGDSTAVDTQNSVSRIALLVYCLLERVFPELQHCVPIELTGPPVRLRGREHGEGSRFESIVHVNVVRLHRRQYLFPGVVVGNI